jgi:hypothetical protein
MQRASDMAHAAGERLVLEEADDWLAKAASLFSQTRFLPS